MQQLQQHERDDYHSLATKIKCRSPDAKDTLKTQRGDRDGVRVAHSERERERVSRQKREREK